MENETGDRSGCKSGNLASDGSDIGGATDASSDRDQVVIKDELYKTEMCNRWSRLFCCRYGDKCRFAHGKDELREPVRHPLYKTIMCKSFQSSGQCRYGIRCRFIHNESNQTDKMLPQSYRGSGDGKGAYSGGSISRVPSAPANMSLIQYSQSGLSDADEKSTLGWQNPAERFYFDLRETQEVHHQREPSHKVNLPDPNSRPLRYNVEPNMDSALAGFRGSRLSKASRSAVDIQNFGQGFFETPKDHDQREIPPEFLPRYQEKVPADAFNGMPSYLDAKQIPIADSYASMAPTLSTYPSYHKKELNDAEDMHSRSGSSRPLKSSASRSSVPDYGVPAGFDVHEVLHENRDNMYGFSSASWRYSERGSPPLRKADSSLGGMNRSASQPLFFPGDYEKRDPFLRTTSGHFDNYQSVHPDKPNVIPTESITSELDTLLSQDLNSKYEVYPYVHQSRESLRRPDDDFIDSERKLSGLNFERFESATGFGVDLKPSAGQDSVYPERNARGTSYRKSASVNELSSLSDLFSTQLGLGSVRSANGNHSSIFSLAVDKTADAEEWVLPDDDGVVFY